jgi:hypothetical protein
MCFKKPLNIPFLDGKATKKWHNIPFFKGLGSLNLRKYIFDG